MAVSTAAIGMTDGRPVVLVGLMGVGKTCVGRRLAKRLGLDFVDADEEIERAADATIAEIFAEQGEVFFREGERKVIARLLDGGPRVIATGGGAFMDPETRDRIRKRGISVWIKADIDLMVSRTVNGRTARPLLAKGDIRETLERLMRLRYPVYGEADIAIDSLDEPPEETVERIMTALNEIKEKA